MRYTINSGTNDWGECAEALRGLLGRLPIVDGPEIAAYETAFAEACGARRAFSLAAGRMALYRILEALGIGPGDEVVLPAFTCVVVPNAILYRGATPVYVDIDARTFNIDPRLIEAKLTTRTKAIIAQHTFGLLCDVPAISAIARPRGIAVIEDAAHALGAERGGRRAGSLADAAYFSTDHSKVISTSTGGMVTTSDPALAARLQELQEKTPFLAEGRIRGILRTFVLEWLLEDPRFYALGRWILRVLGRLGLRSYFTDELSLERPAATPYPARLSCAQARIGLSQLRQLPENLAWRRHCAALYGAARGETPFAPAGEHVFLRYTFLVEDRAAWIERYRDVLDMGVWFTSVAHGRDHDLGKIGYAAGSCPVAEDAARRCVNLPTHPRISRPELLAARLRRSDAAAK